MSDAIENCAIERIIATLCADHVRLKHMFDRHQEELVGGRYELSHEFLLQFQRLLADHVTVEEQQILDRAMPRTSTRVNANLYRAEHRQMGVMVEQIERMFVEASSTPLTRRKMIDLIDAERPLKGMLEHHCHREETVLFPAIAGFAASPAGEPTYAI